MRTLLGRVLLVVIGVALLAIVATALVADRIARDDLDDALDRDFESEQAIYTELGTFAFLAGSWDQAGPVVDELAQDFGERIALTDLDGNVLADSARQPDGTAPPLPRREVAFIDPFSEAFVFSDGLPPEAFVNDLFDAFDFSALERCFDALGLDADLPDDGFGGFLRFGDVDAAAALEEEIGSCFAGAEPDLGPGDEPFAAVEPALLYIGEGSGARRGLLAGGPDWRLLLLIGGVGMAATAITVVAIRPLFSPLRTLEVASAKLGRGDLTARADERGVDELAQLAGQFNKMATSLESEDQRRRRLTSDIAHELRTPLANMQGYLEAAQDRLVPVDDTLVASLHDDSLLLAGLVDDLQTLSLADAGALRLTVEPVPVLDVLRSTVASHHARADEAGVSLALGAGAADVVAHADRRRLRQVLDNLLGNAIRHTPPGGSVHMHAARAGDRVHLSVTDTGEGIPVDDQDRIFERFARVDSSRQRATGGSGLGLAITRELVSAMGGTVSVTSAIGDGSTFTIDLPGHQVPQAAIEPSGT